MNEVVAHRVEDEDEGRGRARLPGHLGGIRAVSEIARADTLDTWTAHVWGQLWRAAPTPVSGHTSSGGSPDLPQGGVGAILKQPW
mgnify:CR=1 FL=1